jgi:hypothetical protein
MFTVPCEAIINTHPAVFRSALVGVGPPGRQTPGIVAEPHAENWPLVAAARRHLTAELRELAGQHSTTAPIRHFLLRRALPVDIRHNAKIFREKLAPWAAKLVVGG